ncbi:MAG: type VI secretion system tube protein Hcp [Pseudomonadota bacterium]
MAVYLKLAALKGNVTDPKHKDWIKIDTVQFGIGRAISSVVGTVANREASTPSLSEVTLTKQLDASSLPLLKMSLGGTTGEDAVLHFVKVDADAQDTYMEIKLSDTLVSSYSTSATSDTAPSESFSLNFTKITCTHKTFDNDHKVSGSFSAGYDMIQAKTL